MIERTIKHIAEVVKPDLLFWTGNIFLLFFSKNKTVFFNKKLGDSVDHVIYFILYFLKN